MLRVRDREAEGLPLVAKVWTTREGLQDEARAEFALLARVRSPCLAVAYDLACDVRTRAPFLVEELVVGRDLREVLSEIGVLAREAPARANEALATCLADLFVAVGALHRAGFLHGDLKPCHVRFRSSAVAANAWPVLLDLGCALPLAEPSRGLESQGLTRKYAAPELLRGEPKSTSSDLYAIGASVRACLERVTPWVEPAIADLLTGLTHQDPSRRPDDTEDALEALGLAAAMRTHTRAFVPTSVPGAIGREMELGTVLSARGVVYVKADAGMGKSHLLRETLVRAKLSGRPVRLHRFPEVDPETTRELVSALRRGEFPTLREGPSALAPLVLIDGLDEAPLEVYAALDAYRCAQREVSAPLGPTVVAASRAAPNGAVCLDLPPLDETSADAMARSLGLSGSALTMAKEAARGRPAWLVAASGQAPLALEAVMSAVEGLPEDAKDALYTIAALGGVVVASALCVSTRALRALVGSGLVAREGQHPQRYVLFARQAAPDVARDVATASRVADTAAIALASVDYPPRALLDFAREPSLAAETCAALLARAAETARAGSATAAEIDALLALCAIPEQRTAEALVRAERLLRDSGRVAAYPMVATWLEEESSRDPALGPLAKRRAAEACARAADHERAVALAEESLRLARERGAVFDEAAALATIGAIALYRADSSAAEVALGRAQSLFSTLDDDDVEERAKLAHNRAVCAMYRGENALAKDLLSRALSEKRRLGDRAGSRACLLNLGIVLHKLGDFEAAEGALDEAIALALSLNQAQGRAWCLGARAEVALGRGDPVRAARAVAEARALGDSVPAPVRADLHLMDAELALLSADPASVARSLAELDPELRARDALVDARALAIEAEAALGQGKRGRAARTSLLAVRRARGAQISHLEGRAWGIFREARMKGPPRSLLAWLDTTAGSASREASERALLSALVTSTRAERAFLVELDSRATEPIGIRVVGLDSEGLAVGEPERRVDVAELRSLATGASRVLRPKTGEGSRIVAVRPGERSTTVLVVEHRFAKAWFDDLADTDMLAFVSAAAIAGHLAAPPEGMKADRTLDVRGPVDAFAFARAVSLPEDGVERLSERSDEETTYFPSASGSAAFPRIVGKSLSLERAKARLAVAAKSDLPVLLTGETGTGKEVFAQALHLASARAKGPFVPLNCGAIAENLFESELFGHARGAYTGAERSRPGLLATAEKGTLFLDEIGELPPLRQAALLRILETRRYRPVGGDEERTFDVRIVAATNRNLDVEVEAGRFRRDLLYRLDVLKIEIPPLRERREDIGLLVDHFLQRADRPLEIAKDARAALEAHGWPGNVRELEHEIARLLALGVARVGRSSLSRRTREGAASPSPSVRDIRSSIPEKDLERKALDAALASAQGNLTHAAKTLGITRQGLKKRMVRLGLRPKKENEP